MRIFGTRLGEFLAGATVVAALILVGPARDLCGWMGRFNLGVVFLLGLVGVVELAELGDAGAEGVAAVLQRMAAQLPLGLAVLTGLLSTGTFNLRAISLAQAGGFSRWMLFHDPFSATGLVIAVVALQGIFKSRLANGEGAAAGRGARNGVALFVMCALLTSVFLGAWYDPFGIVGRLEGMSVTGARHLGFAVMAAGLGAAVFFAKALGLAWIESFFGRHLPRYRMGELFHLGAGFLLPAAGFNFLAGAGYLWLVEPLGSFEGVVRVVLAVVLPLAGVGLAVGIFVARRAARRAAAGDGRGRAAV